MNFLFLFKRFSMFRLFFLPFLLLFVFGWLATHTFLIIIKLAYSVVCFFVMLILNVTVIGFADKKY